jgi:hypothetical protein
VKKKEVLDFVSRMPDEIDFDDLVDALYSMHKLLRKIEIAEAQAAAGDVVPHAEVERLIDEWRK